MICRSCQRALARARVLPGSAAVAELSRPLSTSASCRLPLPTRPSSTSGPRLAIAGPRTSPRSIRLLSSSPSLRIGGTAPALSPAPPAESSSSPPSSTSSSASAPEGPDSSASSAPGAAPLQKPDYLDAAESTIWDRLVAEFAPVELAVRDVSGGCGSMYSIDMTSARFRGATMLKQQRMVNAVLGDLMKGWHGVQLRTKAP